MSERFGILRGGQALRIVDGGRMLENGDGADGMDSSVRSSKFNVLGVCFNIFRIFMIRSNNFEDNCVTAELS